MSEPTAVVGYGYCGKAFASASAGPVVAVDRFRNGVPDGVRAERLDLAEGGRLTLPPGSIGAAVITIGTRGNAPNQLEHLVADLATAGARRVVYLSSTSVYGDRGGGVVGADSPVDPDTRMGQARVAAERALTGAAREAGVDALVLRLPGIYGPGRTLRDRLERGDYLLPDVADEKWSNRIHRDDVVTAIQRLLEPDVTPGTYLACDGGAFRASDLVNWTCDVLGLPQPQRVPLEEISPFARQFWVGNRRCDAAKLRATGWEPAIPDYRSGHLAAWAEEGRPATDEPTPSNGR